MQKSSECFYYAHIKESRNANEFSNFFCAFFVPFSNQIENQKFKPSLLERSLFN